MTRPSPSLNWYEPGASGMVPAAGRSNDIPLACPTHVDLVATPAWYSGDISAPRPTTPRMGDQAVPAGRESGLSGGGPYANAESPGAAARAVPHGHTRRPARLDRRGQGRPG